MRTRRQLLRSPYHFKKDEFKYDTGAKYIYLFLIVYCYIISIIATLLSIVRRLLNIDCVMFTSYSVSYFILDKIFISFYQNIIIFYQKIIFFYNYFNKLRFYRKMINVINNVSAFRAFANVIIFY